VKTKKTTKPKAKRTPSKSRKASGATISHQRSAPEKTRDVILKAALNAFARDGFDGASLPKIAEAANVGHPLVHYHFGSKEDLWRAAVDFAFDGILEQMAAATAQRDGDPLEQLRTLIRMVAAQSARRPEHFRLIIMESRADTERFAWFYDTYIKSTLDILIDAIERAKRKGQIKPIPTPHLKMIIMGATVLFFGLNLDRKADTDTERAGDAHAKYVIEAMFNGICT
jgi:AcrR family transcriptional regulator